MALQTKYITPEEFKEYTGIDLQMIRDDANPSNKQQAFLARVERRMETLIDVECFRKVEREYPNFNDFQKQCYKYALLEQALYIFRNGELSVDSGIDPDKGVVIPIETIQHCALAPNAKRELQRCGLWCKHVRMSDWAGQGGPLGWWI